MTEHVDGEPTAIPVDAAICIEESALHRLRPVIRHLCVGLVDQSVRVRVVTSSQEGWPLASLGPVELLVHEPLVWPMRRKRFRALVDAMVSRPPNAVYAVGGDAFAIGASLSEALDAEYVVQLTASRDFDALDRIPRERLGYVVAASEPLLRLCAEHGATQYLESTCIKPGVLRGTENTSFDNDNEAPTVLCTTPLEASRGVDVIIEAVGIVRDRGHQMLLFLTGAGPDEAALRKIVRARKLSASVTFARPTAEVIEIMRGADVFVMAPGDEEISARPLQAMASGTAVVCFATGVGDCFHDDKTAAVCKEPTARSLADVFESLLIDRARARRIADSAREYVKEHHSMSVMADRTAEVLRKALMRRQTFPIQR
jgi:glycosyltransferase involved in cell wall biosynthesis